MMSKVLLASLSPRLLFVDSILPQLEGILVTLKHPRIKTHEKFLCFVLFFTNHKIKAYHISLWKLSSRLV